MLDSAPSRAKEEPLRPMLRHLVTIFYRESTDQLHACGDVVRMRPYEARYEVHASHEEGAMALAIEAFDAAAAASWRGWVREITEIHCEVIGDDVSCQLVGAN